MTLCSSSLLFFASFEVSLHAHSDLDPSDRPGSSQLTVDPSLADEAIERRSETKQLDGAQLGDSPVLPILHGKRPHSTRPTPLLTKRHLEA